MNYTRVLSLASLQTSLAHQRCLLIAKYLYSQQQYFYNAQHYTRFTLKNENTVH